MKFSSLFFSFLLVAGTLWACLYAFSKHFFPRLYKSISLLTAVCLLTLGTAALIRIEYIPALRHLSHYRELQGASDAKVTSRETLVFLDGCQFRLTYKEDPYIAYIYRYTSGEGMFCRLKSISGNSAEPTIHYPPVYPPRAGYVRMN